MENEKEKIDYVSRAELFEHGIDIKKRCQEKSIKLRAK